MLSSRTLGRLTSLSAFLNTAPGLRGGQPAEERLTAGTQLPAVVPELQEGEKRLRVAAAALARSHDLRERLTEVWSLAAADEAAALRAVNALLAEAGPLRLEPADAPDADGPSSGAVVLGAAAAPSDAVERLEAMAALALADAAIEGELDRLRVCAGQDCENTLVDASRNRSKRFCDAANCANRTHVRSYRARLAEAEGAAGAPSVDTPADAPAVSAAPARDAAPSEAAEDGAQDGRARRKGGASARAEGGKESKGSKGSKESKAERKAREKAEKKARRKADKKAEKKALKKREKAARKAAQAAAREED